MNIMAKWIRWCLSDKQKKKKKKRGPSDENEMKKQNGKSCGQGGRTHNIHRHTKYRHTKSKIRLYEFRRRSNDATRQQETQFVRWGGVSVFVSVRCAIQARWWWWEERQAMRYESKWWTDPPKIEGIYSLPLSAGTYYVPFKHHSDYGNG